MAAVTPGDKGIAGAYERLVFLLKHLAVLVQDLAASGETKGIEFAWVVVVAGVSMHANRWDGDPYALWEVHILADINSTVLDDLSQKGYHANTGHSH